MTGNWLGVACLSLGVLLAACAPPTVPPPVKTGDGAKPVGPVAEERPATKPQKRDAAPVTKAALADQERVAALEIFKRTRRGWCKAFLAPDRVGDFAGRVALTFDDGPHSVLLPRVIRTLRKHGAPATFFMLGSLVRGYRAPEGYDIASLQAAPDITIANHTWSHPNLIGKSVPFLYRQIDRAHAALRAAGARPTLFRSPLGVIPCGAEGGLKTRGYTDVGWHVDSADWCFASGGRCTPGEYRLFRWVPRSMRTDMTAYILHQLRSTNGGILLFHDIQHYTASRLDQVLTAIRGAGFTFTTVDDVRTFPRLNGRASAPARRIVRAGARCSRHSDCDYGLPSFLGFCHPDGYCSMPCENRCLGRGMTCRADSRAGRPHKVCLRRG